MCLNCLWLGAHCGLCGAGEVKSSKCVSVSTGSRPPPTSHDHVFATLCVRHRIGHAAQRARAEGRASGSAPRPTLRPTGHRTLDSVHKSSSELYATTKRLERRARARAKRTSAGAIMQAIRFRSDIASDITRIPIQSRSRALLMTPATVACDAYSRARDRITCMHYCARG